MAVRHAGRQTRWAHRHTPGGHKAWLNELGPPTHVVHAHAWSGPGLGRKSSRCMKGKRSAGVGLHVGHPPAAIEPQSPTRHYCLCRRSKLYQVARPGPRAGQSFKPAAAGVDTRMHTSSLVVWEVHSLLPHSHRAQTDKRARAHTHSLPPSRTERDRHGTALFLLNGQTICQRALQGFT